jgi:hypothetical protein
MINTLRNYVFLKRFIRVLELVIHRRWSTDGKQIHNLFIVLKSGFPQYNIVLMIIPTTAAAGRGKWAYQSKTNSKTNSWPKSWVQN